MQLVARSNSTGAHAVADTLVVSNLGYFQFRATPSIYALEIREAIATLRGEGPADLMELSVASAAHLVALCDGGDLGDARGRVATALDDGSALDAYDRWVTAIRTGVEETDNLDRAVELTRLVVAANEAAGSGVVITYA